MSCACPSTNNQTFDPNDLQAQQIQEKINNHPCYSEGAHQHYARIHVAVAPACNIQCNYCNRKYDCSNESRPGVTSAKLKPLDAVKKVLHIGSQIKQLSVVGIAGPGDALANPKKSFETFALLQEHAPDLKLCLSTNGLKIADHIDEIIKYNIDHVTVTINSVDESGEVGAKIYPWVYYEHKRYKGTEAAQLLLKKQLEGIKLLVDNGILVKANSVLIPGINEEELPNVAKKLKSMGVFLHNIMPLISKAEYGTKFGLEGVPSASDEAVMKAQEACGMDMNLMRHCRQCRADAVGLVGEDRGSEFDENEFRQKDLRTLAMQYNIKDRAAHHEKIEQWRKALEKANDRIKIEQATKEQLGSKKSIKRVAVTSGGEGVINMHFGSAKEFLIYEAGDKGIRFVMHRKIESAYCQGSENCDGSYPIDEIKTTLKDCDLLLTQKIGECPMDEMRSIDLICDETYALEPIEKSVFEAVQKHFFAPLERG
jgi:nitrogen fixation protein NifB